MTKGPLFSNSTFISAQKLPVCTFAMVSFHGCILGLKWAYKNSEKSQNRIDKKLTLICFSSHISFIIFLF